MPDFIDRSLSWGIDSLMRDEEDITFDLENCESMMWEQADFGDHNEPLFPDLHLDDEILASMELPVDEASTLLPLDKRFEETQKSLEECMRKSQETRMSLTISTDEIKEHLKNRETSGVVDSVQESARKLQACIVVPTDIMIYPTAAEKA